MASIYQSVFRNGGLLASQLQNHAASMGVMARNYNVIYGDLNKLAPKVKKHVEDSADLCQPDAIHICDGSAAEKTHIDNLLLKAGVFKPLPKYPGSYLTWTDPADVARVESKTLISTVDKTDTIPEPAPGVQGKLGYWMSPGDLDKAIHDRFPGCMKGQTMYVMPYSMGPIGSSLAKYGIQCTDSAYVTASMRIMTRMGSKVLESLGNDDFIKCLHSVGAPRAGERPVINNWPCHPEKVLVSHIPSDNAIISYGSGYGGNSLLGKKCFSLRLGSILAQREGWLAEHMLILGITNPKGQKHYIAAAFPSQCGKTNLALMNPTIPGYKIECVGDDICWMRFDDEGRLRAINPEYGFFGVAPGTSMDTNPNAVETIRKNTLFTNVAQTDDGGVYWEGLEKDMDISNKCITDWKGKSWQPGCGRPSSHPNSRFCTPAEQCPIMDPEWESPRGVPISAILFGGRRPKGVPLVYEAFNWPHAVFIGASMRSEATAAAEHKGKEVMHDPFAMRPFFGYNFGKYLDHWLSMEKRSQKLPQVFHVNWFRKDDHGKFIWPGFGENNRVLDWILRRVEGEDVAQESHIGYIPKEGSINIDGLGPVDMKELFNMPKDFWVQECKEIEKYFKEQIPNDLPQAIGCELEYLKQRTDAL